MTTFPWWGYALGACEHLYMAILWPETPQAPMHLQAAERLIKRAKEEV